MPPATSTSTASEVPFSRLQRPCARLLAKWLPVLGDEAPPITPYMIVQTSVCSVRLPVDLILQGVDREPPVVYDV